MPMLRVGLWFSTSGPGFRDAYEAQLAGASVMLDEIAVTDAHASRAVREVYAAWGDEVAKIHPHEADMLANAGARWGPRIVRVVISRDATGWAWKVVRGSDLLYFQTADDREDALTSSLHRAAEYVADAELVPIEHSAHREFE